MVQSAEDQESEREHEAKADEKTAAGEIPKKDSAEAKARRHDGDPRDHRIGDREERAVKRENGLLMKNVPEKGEATETFRSDWIKQVVRGDKQETERRKNFYGQMNQRRKHYHAKSEHPENGEDEERACPIPFEEQDEAEDGEFEKHQPEAAGKKEARELRQRAAVLIPEKRADACGESKYRSAEMSDPAGEKQSHGGGEFPMAELRHSMQFFAHAANFFVRLTTRRGGERDVGGGLRSGAWRDYFAPGEVQRSRISARNLVLSFLISRTRG